MNDYINTHALGSMLQWKCRHCGFYHFLNGHHKTGAVSERMLRKLGILVTLPKNSDAYGNARQKLHDSERTSKARRLYSDRGTEHKIGVKGEIAFGITFDNPADLSLQKKGDGHIDFTFTTSSGRKTVDVKSSTNPIHLLVKDKEIRYAADIFVLAGVDGYDVTLIGWETKEVMMKAPVKDFGIGLGLSHYIEAKNLRPILSLWEYLE